MTPCAVHTRSVDGVISVITITGTVYDQDVNKISAFISQFLESDIHTLVLDLSAVTKINSDGLAIVVSAQNQCQKVDKALVLVNPSEPTLKLLHIMKLDTEIDIRTGTTADIIARLT